MSFDKAKAMRNAERFVAQGKIRNAITEYRSVVEHDPRDIATLNMLGDLLVKNSDKSAAVRCYEKVGEHYSKQGFAQKAIAIYNKIARIEPNSIDITAKLAELHKIKGSLAEARAHYATVAEHYDKWGRKIEALAMYKQIALLDPNNTEVCVNLAESFLREGQQDDAVEAFAEAGARFSRKGDHEQAINILTKGYELRHADLRILNGLIRAYTDMGEPDKATLLLEEILGNEPYNRDVLYLLIECCIDSKDASGAERAVIKLVEIEPANYPKFFDLIRMHLDLGDANSAARVLTMSSEYMLAGGQSEECGNFITEILDREPMNLAGLRLLVRYNSWLNDEDGFRVALEQLNSAAADQQSIDDERFALAQLVIIRPHETHFRDRLKEITDEYGYDDAGIDEELLKAQFVKEVPDGDPGAEGEAVIERNGVTADAGDTIAVEPEADDLSPADEAAIQKELDSISFYIDNDYNDLAERSIGELSAKYGNRTEFDELRRRIGSEMPSGVEMVDGEIVGSEDEAAENVVSIHDLREELGLEAAEIADTGDFDTYYQTALAYQGMGLMEDAIREFQDAIALTSVEDGTRNFFYCSNLLGHCFLQNGRANHAITWFNRALATPGITDEEQHGLWYELAQAYEILGEEDSAAQFFEKIYAENVDFRDVSNKVRNLVVNP